MDDDSLRTVEQSVGYFNPTDSLFSPEQDLSNFLLRRQKSKVAPKMLSFGYEASEMRNL
jgi:hypothetical protein